MSAHNGNHLNSIVVFVSTNYQKKITVCEHKHLLLFDGVTAQTFGRLKLLRLSNNALTNIFSQML